MAALGPRCLSPGYTEANFRHFIERLQQICNPENVTVISDDFPLDDGDCTRPCKVHDMHFVYDREFFIASAVVCPRDVPEVQSVMCLCNELKMPVWPYSAGRNTGYGGTAPRVPGSLGVNLGEHMNRVLEVNVEGAYALLEPGVTYAGLYEHLVATGLDKELWLDVSAWLVPRFPEIRRSCNLTR